jgi:hypothetical protein
MRIIRIDNAEEVRLRETSLLVRVFVDEERHVYRCLIRHLGSGREAYFQGGEGLATFVRACVLDGQIPGAPGDELSGAGPG